MITTKFYLDSRHVKDGKPSSLKLAITYNQKAVYFPLKIKLLPNCWDNVAQKILRVPNKDSLMSFILEFKNKVDKIIYSFVNKNVHFNDVNEVKAAIETELKGKPIVDENLFCNYFLKFANRKLNVTTKNIYLFTLKRIHDFDKNIDFKRFEDINKNWLTDFENHLALTSNSKNGRNVHLRNIRAVFNDAILSSFHPAAVRISGVSGRVSLLLLFFTSAASLPSIRPISYHFFSRSVSKSYGRTPLRFSISSYDIPNAVGIICLLSILLTF